MSVIGDLRDECAALDTFVAALDAQQWQQPTMFFGWTTYDEIIHNHYLDLLAMQAVQNPGEFTEIAADIMRRSRDDPDYSIRVDANKKFGILTKPAALQRWRDTYQAMCALFESRDPAERLPWFGPPMSVEACASARQMEVWAHGQDAYDLFRVRRANQDYIHNIALLGVKTFGWSFINRRLKPPPTKPFVSLSAPSGASWSWNEAASSEQVVGTAEDFCLVVTQRRHVDDTRLKVVGAGARGWMEIAQCFAGDPAQGPAAGKRIVQFADGGRL